MNKKILAAAIAFLMVVGTVFVAVPVHAIATPVDLSSTSGAAGSTQTISAGGLTAGREAFVMFDKEVADADLGAPLFAFLANEMYWDQAPLMGGYTPGNPIYLDVPAPDAGALFVSAGDIRLSPVRVGAVTFAAGTTVAIGNADIGPALTPFAANEMHTGAATGFVWATDGIYLCDPSNIALASVGPGDIRARYPNVTVIVAGTGMTETYAAWTKVKSPVLDFQKPIYDHLSALIFGSVMPGLPVPQQVAMGDLRLRNVVIPQVRYAAGSTVTIGQEDWKQAPGGTVAFPTFPVLVVYVDLNGNGRWDAGEWIYHWVGAGPWPSTTDVVQVGDLRLSYVGLYLPSSTVAAGDLDVGLTVHMFSGQSFIDSDGNTLYNYGEWIYNQAAGIWPLMAPWTTRASNVDFTDKGMAATGTLSGYLMVPWTTDWSNVLGYAAMSFVAPGDSDAGRTLTRFAARDRHATGIPVVPPALPAWLLAMLTPAQVAALTASLASVITYVSGQHIYRDNDNDFLSSIGDTRQVIVRNTNAVPFAGPYPFTAAAAPYYIAGTTVAAGNPDTGFALGSFGANEYYYDEFNDAAYLGSDMVAVGGVGNTFFASPFPVTFGLTAANPIPFTVPTNAPIGNHAVFITTDQPPTPPLGGIPFVEGFTFAGWQAGALALLPAGSTLQFESLPWFVGEPFFDIGWPTSNFATEAGPAFFVVNVPVRVFLHPGVADPYKPGWSHTLDTLWGTQGGTPGVNTNGLASSINNPQTRELFEHYLDYAILASSSDSVGDLQFDLTVLAPINGFRIYIPGETPWGKGDGFRWLAPSREEAVWTDITNDYEFIYTSSRSAYDLVSPYSIRLDIGNFDWYSGNQMTIMPGTYHIRLFDLAAPHVAGLYHFKIAYFVGGLLFSIGAGNYPIMIVKSELNPAWISVDVRAHFQFPPALISGSVLAEGTTPEGRTVWAQGWWGPNEWVYFSAVPGQFGQVYRVFLFGVAAGTYTLTAQGSGYSPTVSDRITVDPGQSYHLAMVIFDSPDFHVTLWSKHGTGAIPWHNLWQLPFGTNDPYVAPNNAGPRRDVTLELYDSSGALIGWWASNALRPWAPKSIATTNTLTGLHDDFSAGPAFSNGGTIPNAVQYNAWLTDNWDLLGNLRGAASHDPSTKWDGHVPWTTPDYTAGIPNGQYSVEAWITGYLMDEMDAYQRTVTVSGIAIGIQMDLRRTNWIETVMYLPNNVFLSTADTTVTLVPEDSGGNERGAAGLSVSYAIQTTVPAASTHRIDAQWVGLMPNAIAHDGGIVIEGWNSLFPAAGGGRGAFRDVQVHDYGLNPSKPAVDILVDGGTLLTDGNSYKLALYMSDMGFPYLTGMATPASTALAGSPRGTGWYSIVGDPTVDIFLCNSPSLLSFTILNAWLWISMRSVDFEVPAHSRPWTFPGSEMWVAFLDSTGAIADVLDPTVYGLVQDAGTTVAGWPITGAPAGSFGVSPFDIDNVNLAGRHEHVGVTYYGTDVCSTTLGGGWGWPYGLIDGWRSTRLPAGEYTYNVYTHGYIMRRSFPVQVPANLGADIEADLIQGGQIRVIVDFKHEAFATAFNGFIRMEVFNDAGDLVGASIYGQANTNQFLWGATPGGAYLRYDPLVDHMGGILGLNLGPAQAHDFGLPTVVFPSSDPLYSNGQRGFWSWLFYGVPAFPWWPNTLPLNFPWPATRPSDANRFLVPDAGAQAIDVFGFYWYYGDAARTWAGGWPTTNGISEVNDANPWSSSKWDSGIRGSVDIPGWSGSGGGSYSIKIWAFDPRGPNNAYEAALPSDDWRMYAMGWPLENIEVPWGGSVAYFVDMNDMASLRGTVQWIDMFGNQRPLAWAQVSATNPDTIAYTTGNGAVGTGSSNPSGGYIMWLPAGTHDVSVSTSEAPGIWSSAAPTQNAAFTVVVSDGWVGTPLTVLGPSGTPVPELPPFVVGLGLFAALAASVWLLRRRNLINIPVVIK